MRTKQTNDNDIDLKIILGLGLGFLLFCLVVYIIIKIWENVETVPQQTPPRNPPQPSPPATHNRVVDLSEVVSEVSFDMLTNLSLDCAICLEDFINNEIVYRLRCGHTYHADCISAYLSTNNLSCPVCRQAV